MNHRLRRLLKFGPIESTRWLGYEVSRAIQRASRSRTSGKVTRIAIISDRDAWCSEQQLNPFDEFRSRLADEFNILLLQIYLDEMGYVPPVSLTLFDAIMLKLSYRTSEEKAISITRHIKDKIGNRPLIYMDGDDDICVQWGGIVELSDLYVKCHAFSDRSQYLKRFKGKSNLHHHAIEHHGHVLTAADYGGPNQDPLIISQSGAVRAGDLKKIVVGWNMAMAEDILGLWRHVIANPPPEKTIDCSFRGSIKTETITGYMRQETRNHLEKLSDSFNILVTNSHISRGEYYKELMQCKICVSPFGFGELCWRDFEAVLCRSLLIKPDMSHIETNPDIFVPHVTYVPVKWDLSDLQETCEYYLQHDEERDKIAENAFNVLHSYYRDFDFGKDLIKILISLNLR